MFTKKTNWSIFVWPVEKGRDRASPAKTVNRQLRLQYTHFQNLPSRKKLIWMSQVFVAPSPGEGNLRIQTASGQNDGFSESGENLNKMKFPIFLILFLEGYGEEFKRNVHSQVSSSIIKQLC